MKWLDFEYISIVEFMVWLIPFNVKQDEMLNSKFAEDSASLFRLIYCLDEFLFKELDQNGL